MNKRNWYKINAEDKILGRLACEAAAILMGKNKVAFERYKDIGDFLIITNSLKVKLTGAKSKDKTYFRPSRYPGNSKLISYPQMLDKNPQYIIYHAVKGMLPKNKLAANMIKRLKIYETNEHPHNAQNPIAVKEQND